MLAKRLGCALLTALCAVVVTTKVATAGDIVQAGLTLSARLASLEKRVQSVERSLSVATIRIGRCEANLTAAQGAAKALEQRLGAELTAARAATTVLEQRLGESVDLQLGLLEEHVRASTAADDHSLLQAQIRDTANLADFLVRRVEERTTTLEHEVDRSSDAFEGYVETTEVALRQRDDRARRLGEALSAVQDRTDRLEAQSLRSAETMACMPNPAHEWYSFDDQCWASGRSVVAGSGVTLEQCEQECLREPACQGINFAPPDDLPPGPEHVTSNCFLVSACEPWRERPPWPGWSSFVLHRDCRAFPVATPPQEYEPAAGCFPGEGYYLGTGTSRSECEGFCDTGPDCIGYSWDPSGEDVELARNCRLIRECSGGQEPGEVWESACRGALCSSPEHPNASVP